MLLGNCHLCHHIFFAGGFYSFFSGGRSRPSDKGGGGGGGGLGVVIHVCLHVFYLDPEIRGEAGPPGPSPESATV